jgi:hypothetical protein
MTVIGIGMIEYALFKTKAVRDTDQRRDGRFPTFRRWDVWMWQRWRLYLFAPLVPIRFGLAIFNVIYHLPITKLIIKAGGH